MCMKNKQRQFTAIIVIAAFMGQGAVFARPAKFSSLRPRAFGESKETHMAKRPNEIIYEVNTRALGKRFGQITDADLKRWKASGATIIWFMGAWEISPYSKTLNKFWEKENNEKLERTASAYSITEYEISHDLGGEEEFKDLVRRANEMGLSIMLDIVVNHMAADTPLLASHPEYFMSPLSQKLPGGTAENMIEQHKDKLRLEPRKDIAPIFQACTADLAADAPVPAPTLENVFFYGAAPYLSLDPPWTDTVNFNYAIPAMRQYMKEVIFKAAELTNGGGLRFDLVFYAFRDHIRWSWFRHLSDEEFDAIYPSQEEFWGNIIPELKRKYPNIILLAEMYGSRRQGDLTAQMGFDYYYEDYFRFCLLDRKVQDLKNFLRGYVSYLGKTNFIKFLENHDIADRITSKLGKEASLAAATLLYTLPGTALVYHDQEKGYSWSSPSANVIAGFIEEDDPRVVSFYKTLGEYAGSNLFRLGSFKLLEANNADVIAFEREHEGRKAVVVVNYSANNLCGVEIKIDGQTRTVDLLPWESRIETRWWDEKQRGGILCPLFSMKRKGWQGIGDLPALEKHIDLIYRQGADYLVLLPTTQINPNDPCPYVSISLFANNAVGYLGLDELLGQEKLGQYTESFIKQVSSDLAAGVALPNYFSEDFITELSVFVNNIKGAHLYLLDEKALRAKIENYLRNRMAAANSADFVDYPFVGAFKEYCLRQAFEEEHEGISRGANAEFNAYAAKNRTWAKGYGIEEYALFHSLFNNYRGKAWWDWDEEYQDPATLKVASIEALKAFKEGNQKETLFYQYIQWLFYKRWQRVRQHARQNGKFIVGDMPLYPAPNSADAWAKQKIFDRDKNNGAPSESIQPKGQNWGTHPYRWKDEFDEVMEYFEARIRYMAQFYDVIRVDHILGIIQGWLIDVGNDPTTGKFYPSTDEAVKKGEKILRRLAEVAAETNTLLIGEDIGDRDPSIREMLDRLSLELPNLYLYNPVGWRQRHMANRPHVMAVEATHDTPGTFLERLPELNAKEEDKQQVTDFLSVHGIQQVGDSDEAIEDQVIEALKQEPFYCLTLQTLLNIRNARVNVPGSGKERAENWAWVAPEVETLLEKPHLSYFAKGADDFPAVMPVGAEAGAWTLADEETMSCLLRPQAFDERKRDDAYEPPLNNAEQNIQEIPKESKSFISPQEARGAIKQVGKILTFEEEQILFRALHSSWEEKDERIKQEVIDCLVMKNQGLIAQTAQELHMQAVQDDAMQDGNIGLLKAIDRFDYSRGFKFATYAKWWVKQALQRDTRDLTQEIRIPAHIRSRMAKLMKAMSSLTGELGRDPTTEEIAKRLGISEKDVIALFDIRKLFPASLDKKIGEGEDSQLYDIVPGEVGVPFKENLEDIFTCLTFPERIIIKMRNGIGTAKGDYSLDKIANILDLSKERVRQIEAKAIKTLQKAARDKRIRPKAITPIDPDHLDVYLVETFKINPRSPLFKRFYSKGVEGRDRWLKNVREIIAKERPDIMEIYKKRESLTPAEQELLRQSVYKITHRHFVVWKLSGSNSWVPLLYAARSYYQVLMVIFPDIGLSPLGFKLNWSSKREALQSIYFILSREEPDLLKRYNDLKKLNEAQIKNLKDDIYKIDSARLEAWGLRSVFNRRTAPYFHGRYVLALQALFPKLNLDPLGFQLDWSTDKKGIDSVRFILLKEAPSIIERYNRLSELNEHEKEVLKRDVYSITSVHFKLWNLNSAMDMNRAPYFKGSYIDVLLAVFPDLALDRLGFQLNWSTQETGLASLRFVLSKEIPSIIERYDKVNELGEEAKRQLKEDIYKINGALVKQWNIESGIHRQFKGSYIVALIALFPKLNLDPLGFRLDWSTKERALESIRFVLRREIPHIMEKYDNIKNLDEEGKKLLAEEIYELRSGDFQAWNMGNVYHKTQAPYFNGSYIDALIAVFPELRLGRFGFELDWSSREKALESIRFVLKKEIPDIMERYEALDQLDLTQLSRLRNDIYAITIFHLNAWRLSRIPRPEVVKYFGRNYISVLLNVFDHPRLGLSEEGFVTYRKGHTEKKYFWMDGIEAGIQNVKDAILNNRPDIIERYDNLEKLTDAEIELLKRDIYRINSGYFRAWGLTRATIRSSAPYFEGSYIKALQATFPTLNLNSLEFRLDWSSKEKAAESILYVLSKKVPHIVKEYQKFDSLDEIEKKALRKEIYNITAGHFASWGLSVAMDKRKIEYFNGSHIEALRVVFQRLDLNPLGFILDWSTEEKTIESIRFILSSEAPDIIERYDSLDKLSENGIEALKNDIYTLTRAKLKFWGLESIFLRQAVPFFNGNRIETFMAVFSRLNLDPLGFGLDWSTKERSIDSMRFVLSRQAPSIIERYQKLDRSDTTQKKMLRNDIYRISLGHFKIWGLAEALNMQRVPYFGGSYIKALCAAFPDIGLDPLGFQLDWTTRKMAIESIHFVLRKEVPHIMDSYDQIDKLNEAEREKLRRDIYNITNTHFKLWGLSNALDSSKVPFFKGSHKYALIIAFKKLGLEPYGFQLDWSSRQKAIKSIRFVLSKECPLMVARYDTLRLLTKEEIENLREKVCTVTSDHFEAWGLHAVSTKTTVPYFNGSYIKALQAVFPNLQLNSLDFKLEFITPEKAVKSIRHILSKNIPDIMRRYENIDGLTDDEIEKLKEDVYKISSKDLQEWGCISALKNVPYFEGNYIKVLQAAFPKLKLDPIGFSLNWTTRKNAIASVRCVIKQKAPDIIARYNKLDKLTNDEIEELKDDIYAIGEKTFLEWGLSGYKRAPYFKGRYSKTLQAVFPKLKLNMLGFRLDWTNRARAIASISYILKQKRPDIIDRYERRDNLPPDEMLGLKDDIYRLNSKTLIEWGLSHAFNMPYFKGGVCFIMQTIFPDLSLDPLGFNLDWTTKERATESVCFVLKRQIPNIYGRYEKLSSLAPDQIESLKQEIYAISQGDLRKWGLVAALSVPEFKGHYFYVLQAVFAELALDDRGFKSKNLPDKTPPAGSCVKMSGKIKRHEVSLVNSL
jgi:RNA polymerase sigma factor (sigma-70 family)